VTSNPPRWPTYRSLSNASRFTGRRLFVHLNRIGVADVSWGGLRLSAFSNRARSCLLCAEFPLRPQTTYAFRSAVLGSPDPRWRSIRRSSIGIELRLPGAEHRHILAEGRVMRQGFLAITAGVKRSFHTASPPKTRFIALGTPLHTAGDTHDGARANQKPSRRD
jgi:hypothetical protein